MPGMPPIPCLLLAAACSWSLAPVQEGRRDRADAAAPPVDKKRTPAEEVDSALAVDLLCLEVGYELVGVVDAARGGTLLERVASCVSSSRGS